jgi:N-acetylglucosaminyldiphosphoundecaprenol N-acetyl-beta-D-mannosaminyltransferase
VAAAPSDRHLLAVGPPDDLEREDYCVLGLPIDVIEMPAIVGRIKDAAANPAPFLISTPNLNFLVSRRFDPEFRRSILDSDLCPADGMPIIWIGRLIGLPITQRVNGSDIFDVLKLFDRFNRQLKVFLFGSAEGVAAEAARP